MYYRFDNETGDEGYIPVCPYCQGYYRQFPTQPFPGGIGGPPNYGVPSGYPPYGPPGAGYPPFYGGQGAQGFGPPMNKLLQPCLGDNHTENTTTNQRCRQKRQVFPK